MKKSELRQIIKEEVSKVLKEEFERRGEELSIGDTEEKRLKEAINSLVQVYNTIIVGHDLRPQDQESLRLEILKIIGEKLSQGIYKTH